MLFLRECHKLRILQHFGFQKSSYERPAQEWVCGHLDAGKPCAIGPDGRGVCRAQFECQPHHSDQRWQCTRPASRGGECEQGPSPEGICCKAIPKCKPQLNLRAKRGKAARWMVSLAIGFVVILVAFSADLKLLMPGPLNTAHSSLKNCGDCHANVAGGNFGWLHSIFKVSDANKDATACLSCHTIGTAAFSPHGLEKNKLEALSQRHQSVAQKNPPLLLASFRNAIFPTEKTIQKNVNCATCHKEHQGEKFDLTAMSDTQCQTCHMAEFKSFQNGHPEFTKYPFERRTRIIFDHSSHFVTHFPKVQAESKTPGDETRVCADCHKTDANVGLMIVKPYDKMCSSCHTGQIVGDERASGPKGITLMTLPMLDLETLRQRNANIGEWPTGSEAEISPLMKLLIGQDEMRRKMLEAVDRLDLLDLTDATEQDIATIEEFVWQIKSLVHQFIIAKPTDTMKLLSTEEEGGIDIKLLASLTANMPRDVMLGVQREWLPNLFDEVLRHSRGEPLMAPEPADRGEGNKPGDETQNSKINPQIITDDPIRDILSGENSLEATANEEEGSLEEVANEGESSLEATANGDEGSLEAVANEDEGLLEATANEEEGSLEEVANEDEGSREASANEEEGSLEAAANEDESSLEATANEEEGSLEAAANEGEAEKEKTGAAEMPGNPELTAPVEAEDWAQTGGWYRQEFAVLYKPTGHSDGFMRAWLDYSGAQYGKAATRLAAPIFDMLSDKQAQGQCTKCHSIDTTADNNRTVNWKPFSVSGSREKFTKFSHEPHFGLFGDKGCLTCHVVDKDAQYRQTYKAQDPLVFSSNFKPVKQQFCTTCHQKNAAGENCLLCHTYHVGDVKSPMMSTALPDK